MSLVSLKPVKPYFTSLIGHKSTVNVLLLFLDAFTVLKTSLTIHKKPIYNTSHYVTYLQYAIIIYYDLHITLLKELQYTVVTY